MSHIFKISAALLVSASLLVAGCTTMGQTANNPINNDYVLPKEINEGYWATTSLVNGDAVVINFRPGTANIYNFQCNANGRYQQVRTESFKTVPSATGMGLQAEGEPVFSEIKVIGLIAKKSLTLNQLSSDPKIQQRLPNGMSYSYRYTSTLTPICP